MAVPHRGESGVCSAQTERVDSQKLPVSEASTSILFLFSLTAEVGYVTRIIYDKAVMKITGPEELP
jgi:hypothetical protein